MNIIFLGAGNLGTNLAHALFHQGHRIVQVYSRTMESAKVLAEQTGAIPINNFRQLDQDADIYILALKDDVLREIIPGLPDIAGIFVHTAGSVSVDIFEGNVKNYGVFYPLQTFNKNRLVHFSEIPVFIEANSDYSKTQIEQLATSISSDVHQANSEDRLAIHVAAVFACNFTNFMFVGADEILRKYDLSFQSLHPLINETIRKIETRPPYEAQTGPAVRGDNETLKTHLNMLSDAGMWQKLYRFVSDMMIEYYRPDEHE